MNEEAVEPQEEMETVFDQPEGEVEAGVETEEQEAVQQSRTQVPLSALQKERQKKKEIELELQWTRQKLQEQQQMQAAPPVEDNSKYESATREDLSKSQEEAIRVIEERMWIKNNREKYEKVNEQLPQFLKQRPNLLSAINSATNRYEEAYTLMEALTPKQQQQLKSPAAPKKEAPGAPTGVPKAAALNQAVDVMTMSDTEFAAWRQSQKRRR